LVQKGVRGEVASLTQKVVRVVRDYSNREKKIKAGTAVINSDVHHSSPGMEDISLPNVLDALRLAEHEGYIEFLLGEYQLSEVSYNHFFPKK